MHVVVFKVCLGMNTMNWFECCMVCAKCSDSLSSTWYHYVGLNQVASIQRNTVYMFTFSSINSTMAVSSRNHILFRSILWLRYCILTFKHCSGAQYALHRCRILDTSTQCVWALPLTEATAPKHSKISNKVMFCFYRHVNDIEWYQGCIEPPNHLVHPWWYCMYSPTT